MAPSRSDPRFVNDSPTVFDLYDLGKEMMNRAGRNLGTLSVGGPEDRKFRSFFGSGVTVILAGWNMMQAQGLIPDGGLVIHYLWALMFMKIYSSETALCGHAGGVDPKTFRKWVWPFIHALAELEYTVVSFYDCIICCTLIIVTNLIYIYFERFYLKTEKEGMWEAMH